MKILYDYQAFDNKVSGASRAYCKTAALLANKHEITWGLKRSSNIYLQNLNTYQKTFFDKINFKGKHKIYKYLEQKYSSTLIKENRFDLLYPTGEDLYFLDYIKRPFIATIHDMIPENYTKDSRRIEKRKILIEKAARIVTVSANTKKELLEYYPAIDPNKIDIIYHGFEISDFIYENNNWGRYILFVGQRASYKNFLFFVEAVLPLLRQDPDLKILCTGMPFTKEEKTFFAKHSIINYIKTVGYVEDKSLYSLYHNALAFVFPSLYEGFGIPILEAFGNNCPAIISSASCFPEIAGEAAEYFNPRDKNSILQSISKVIYNDIYANELRDMGLQRVQMFTWEHAAELIDSTFKKSVR